MIPRRSPSSYTRQTHCGESHRDRHFTCCPKSPCFQRPNYMAPNLGPYPRRHCFGCQNLYSSCVDFHHMHDWVTEYHSPQFLIRCNLGFDIILCLCASIARFSQHDQASSIGQFTRWNLPRSSFCRRSRRAICSLGFRSFARLQRGH